MRAWLLTLAVVSMLLTPAGMLAPAGSAAADKCDPFFAYQDILGDTLMDYGGSMIAIFEAAAADPMIGDPETAKLLRGEAEKISANVFIVRKTPAPSIGSEVYPVWQHIADHMETIARLAREWAETGDQEPGFQIQAEGDYISELEREMFDTMDRIVTSVCVD